MDEIGERMGFLPIIMGPMMLAMGKFCTKIEGVDFITVKIIIRNRGFCAVEDAHTIDIFKE
jgi:hypothetical protein